jgi:hypothetical protein
MAPVLGRALEGAFQGVLGTGGIENRMISIGTIFVVVLLLVTCAAGFGARRFTRSRPSWRRWNHFAGGAIGLLEGGLLGMAVLWVLLALEPLAQGRAASDEANPAAHRVVEFARTIRQSAVGDLAERTSPMQGSAILTMAEDFAIVSHDPEAMRYFLDTPVMHRIQALPSVARALDHLKQNPELKSMFSESGVVPASVLFTIMRSEAVLWVLDTTTVVDDLTPTVGEIAEALAAAKKLTRR